jgi:hypothetical protein
MLSNGVAIVRQTLAGGFERYRLWLLKNSFQGISPTKFFRKLLNLRSP